MQSIPLAVLKLEDHVPAFRIAVLHAIHTACGIETEKFHYSQSKHTILHAIHTACGIETFLHFDFAEPLQEIACNPYRLRYWNIFRTAFSSVAQRLHAIHTACGIETCRHRRQPAWRAKLHAIHTACGIETAFLIFSPLNAWYCMQSIPLAVLKQKERVLRLSPFAVPAFLCNIYKKAAQVSDDACAAFCISLTMFPSP